MIRADKIIRYQLVDFRLNGLTGYKISQKTPTVCAIEIIFCRTVTIGILANGNKAHWENVISKSIEDFRNSETKKVLDLMNVVFWGEFGHA